METDKCKDLAADLSTDADILRMVAAWTQRVERTLGMDLDPILKEDLDRIADNIETLSWDIRLGALTGVAWDI